MKNIGLIPARGGSKRISQKNIRKFLGKPIIAYTIEAAQQSNCFDRIIVSTDCPNIKAVTLSCGADDLYIDDDLAIDASKRLIKYSFKELNLHRLWAEIYDFDNAKKQMFKTLGFELDGRHRETHWTGGKWVDSLIYSLLNNH